MYKAKIGLSKARIVHSGRVAVGRVEPQAGARGTDRGPIEEEHRSGR